MTIAYVTKPSGPTLPSSLLAVSILLPLLCIVAVALRFNIRSLQKCPLKLDDWLMLPSLIFVIGMGATAILGVQKGIFGKTTKEVRASGVNSDGEEGKLIEAFQYIQILALICIKLGALDFYKRIFCVKKHKSIFGKINQISIGVVLLWGVAMILCISLQCGLHIESLWTGTAMFLKYCGAVTTYRNAYSISNFLLDLWILILPLPKIFGLNTTTPRKLGIASIFLLAFVGLAASILRMVVYVELAKSLYDPATDIFLGNTLQIFWSMIEAGLCLLAVNLPSLWAYHGKISPESLLASIRSVISLRSLRSSASGSQGSRARGGRGVRPLPGEGGSTHSGGSEANILAGRGNDVYATHDVEAQAEAGKVPPGVIMVESTVGYEKH